MSSLYVKQHNRGFTLIELLLYISLTGIVLLGVTFFLLSMLELRERNQTIAEVEQQGAFLLHVMTQAIRNAEDVTTPSESENDSTLSLSMSDSALDPTVFSFSGGVVYLEEGGGQAIPLTNNRVIVSDLLFQNRSRSGTGGLINISFEMEHVNSSNQRVFEYEKIFYGSGGIR